MDLKVQVEKTSNILRKLTVRVPASVVENHFEKGLKEMQRTAKLKGFRPGHVPLTVVKQFYGEDVRHRVFHNLMDESFQVAVRDQKIKVIGRPTFETPEHKTGEGAHDHSLAEGKDLTYIATVEILPEIEVKGYAGVSLKKGSVEITDQDVDQVVQNLRSAQGELQPIEEGARASHKVKKGEFVDLNFHGGLVTETGLDERPGMKGSRLLEVGSDTLIAGFEDHLIGMKVGETKTFRVPFPKDFYEKDMAGKDAEFTATINEIKTRKLPELNDDFAKQMGYESVADMTGKAREHLTQERTQEVQRKLRSDLLQALIDKNEFEVPVALIQSQTRALAQDVAQNVKQQGADEKTIQDILTSEMENIKKRAENQVRASLIIESIAKKEGFEVKADDVSAEIAKLAVSMKVEEPKLREFYEKSPARRDDLEYRIREERTIAFLLEKAKIKIEN